MTKLDMHVISKLDLIKNPTINPKVMFKRNKGYCLLYFLLLIINFPFYLLLWILWGLLFIPYQLFIKINNYIN